MLGRNVPMDHRSSSLSTWLAERVRLLGNPVGPIGVAIGDYMKAVNGALNAGLFRNLLPQSGDGVR